jgi:lipopolysaccharide/colanic/teichoic acid biosynthesis glycosyltransferase
MDMAATDLGSVGGEASELRQRTAGGDGVTAKAMAAKADGYRAFGGVQFAPPPPEGVQVAVAGCRQVATGEIALTPEPPLIQAADYDPDAFEREFRDFDLELSTLVCLSLKRAFDVLASAAALVLLSPLLVLIALLVKLSDGGPVFFGQVRVGLRGRTFRMLKFRSMVVHAERLRPRLEVRNESNGPVFKMRLDPRVTAIGKVIRRYSLDELPQLLNILMGDMSIVGPRPSLPSEVVKYEAWQYQRFAVRPGLTCYWQVSPSRYQISFDDWMRLDLKYVEDWSLGLDLNLILRTFGVVAAGTGE